MIDPLPSCQKKEGKQQMLLQWSAQVKVDRVFLAVSLIDGDLSQSTFLYITLCVWALSGMEYTVV